MVCVIDQTWYMPSKSKLECKLYDEQKCTVRQSPNRCDWEGFFFFWGGGQDLQLVLLMFGRVGETDLFKT